MLSQRARIWVCSHFSRQSKKCGSWRNLHEMTAVGPLTDSSKPPIPLQQGKEVKEIQIPVPWGHISGKWWGRTDVQPVLLLHGWQDNAGSFDTLAPLLHGEALLAVETVGHGRSSHYPLGQSYSYVDCVVNLRRVVRHFGWKGAVSIVGHSMGSLTALGYAAAFPDSVDRLVSLDDIRGALIPTLLPKADDVRRVVDANLAYERKLTDLGNAPSYAYDEIVDLYWKGCNGSVTRESAEIILRRGVVRSEDGRFSFSRDPRWKVFSWDGMSREFALAMASQTTCEVLSIRATESFTSQPAALELYEATLEVLGRSAKRTECRVVEGTHHVHLNNPERVAPLINEFFETGSADNVVY